MAASGRKQTLVFVDLALSERPLSGKGDIQDVAASESLRKDRFRQLG